jgi:transposase
METALESLSKDDLLKAISSRDEKIEYLESQLAMYKRMQFGQKRERFEGDPNQTELPFEAAPVEVEQQQEEIKEKIEYTRKRPNHKGRAKLPQHLPVQEIEIHPEGDLADMVCIGKEITEELECEPAKFYIKRYIRYKYTPKNGDGVRIGELPERVIERGIPGAGLLAMILTGKYQDHLPLYRQKQIFARENIQIASSTIEGWTKEALIKLEPLYEQLVFDTKTKGYLQADETPIKYSTAIKKALPTKVGIGCTIARWIGLCCLTIILHVVVTCLNPCWITLRVTSRRTGILHTINTAKRKISPIWPAGHMHAVSLKKHCRMTVPGPKRHC